MLFKKAIKLVASEEDENLIEKIASRAIKLIPNKYNHLSLVTDITIVHLNSAALNLEVLLTCNDFHLAHDINGIENDLDSRTGLLRGYFNPRCSKERRNEA